MRPPDGCMNKIVALRIGKAMTFKKIYEELVSEFPDITPSWVHKWGKHLPLLSELIPDGKGGFMKKRLNLPYLPYYNRKVRKKSLNTRQNVKLII